MYVMGNSGVFNWLVKQSWYNNAMQRNKMCNGINSLKKQSSCNNINVV